MKPSLRAGLRVRLCPSQRADIVDLALAGQTAEIDRIEEGADGRIHVVVALDDDPALALGPMSQIGHRFFFAPDELELLDDHAPVGPRVLVAGVGDSFDPADGFGAAVVRRFRALGLPAQTHAADFGIRTGDLAHTARGYDLVIAVRTMRLGHAPGTVSESDEHPLPHVHHLIVAEPGTGEVSSAAVDGAVRLITTLIAEFVPPVRRGR